MWTKGTQKNCSNKWVWLNAERRSWIALCIAVSLYHRPLCHCTNSVNMAFRCEGHGIAELLILSTNHRAATIGGRLAVGKSIEGALGESVQRRFSAATIGRIFRFINETKSSQLLCTKIVFQRVGKWGHQLKFSIWFCQYWWLQTTSLREHFHQTKVHLCVFCPHGQFAFFGAHVSEPFK